MTAVRATAQRSAPFVVSALVVSAAAVFAPRPDLDGMRIVPLVSSTLLVALAAVGLCGLRWRLFLPAEWTVVRAVRRYGEGLFAGLFLPLGSDLYRAAGGRAEAQATVVDRFVAGIVTVLAAAVVVPFAGDVWPLPFLHPMAAGGAAALAGLVAGALLVRSHRTTGGRLVAASALTILYVGCVALSLSLTGAAVGVDLPLLAAVVVAPAVLLGAAVPNVFGLSPGIAVIGWLLPATSAAIDPRQATTVALLLVAELWVAGTVGGILLALRRVGR